MHINTNSVSLMKIKYCTNRCLLTVRTLSENCDKYITDYNPMTIILYDPNVLPLCTPRRRERDRVIKPPTPRSDTIITVTVAAALDVIMPASRTSKVPTNPFAGIYHLIAIISPTNSKLATNPCIHVSQTIYVHPLAGESRSAPIRHLRWLPRRQAKKLVEV